MSITNHALGKQFKTEVNILVTDDLEHASPFLVLPYNSPLQLPLHLRHLNWRNMATTTTDDRLLRHSRARIEAEFSLQGYAVVAPETLTSDS